MTHDKFSCKTKNNTTNNISIAASPCLIKAPDLINFSKLIFMGNEKSLPHLPPLIWKEVEVSWWWLEDMGRASSSTTEALR